MTTRQWHCRRNPAQQRVRRADALAAECVSMPQPQGPSKVPAPCLQRDTRRDGVLGQPASLAPRAQLAALPLLCQHQHPTHVHEVLPTPRTAGVATARATRRAGRAPRCAAQVRGSNLSAMRAAPPGRQTPILRTCMSRPMSPAHPNTIFGCGRDTTLPLGGGLALECG